MDGGSDERDEVQEREVKSERQSEARSKKMPWSVSGCAVMLLLFVFWRDTELAVEREDIITWMECGVFIHQPLKSISALMKVISLDCSFV
jgi:hypothetical protein